MSSREHRWSTLRIMALLAVPMLFIAACGGDDDAPADGATTEPTDESSPDSDEDAAAASMDEMSVEELYEAAKSEGEVVIYTSTAIELLDAMKAKWDEQYPDVEFSYVRADQGEVRNRFLAEAQGGRGEADVVGVDAISQLTLGDEDLLADYAPHSIDDFTEPALDAFESGHGVPVRTLGMSYAVNPDMIDSVPQSWEELVESGEQLVWPDPRVGGGAFDLFLRLQQEFGEDFLGEMGDNVELRSSVIAAHDALAAGEFPILVGAYHTLIDGTDAEFVVPTDGVTFLTVEEAIAAEAPHPHAARLYANFVTSPDIQQLIFDEQNYIPIINGTETSGLAQTLLDASTIIPEAELEEFRDSEGWTTRMTELFGL